MAARLAQLRIAGFKSFADPVTLDILPGLTGVIGPNGCGKSNIVEALRWVMGESSAKSLRGSEMDDVIFAGTTSRGSRNIAEVTLLIADATGVAPAPFQNESEIAISRQLERRSGSTYRVNGRELRARDVATLFADLGSGARSAGIISQSRVAALVEAKPEDRRTILEEAAGVAGLHARRHEAELKLRAAEQNLARAEEARVDHENRLSEIRRQARQAARYRNLSTAIKAAELESIAIEHALAMRQRATMRATAVQAHEHLKTTLEAQEVARTELERRDKILAELRDTEAKFRSALERARVQVDQAVASVRAAEAARTLAQQQVEQLTRDLAHAQRVENDAAGAIARLRDETLVLDETLREGPALIVGEQKSLEEIAPRIREAEYKVRTAAEAMARHKATEDVAERSLVAARHAEQEARRRAQESESTVESARAALVPEARLESARDSFLTAEKASADAASALAALRQQVVDAESRRMSAQIVHEEARQAAANAEAAARRLLAEHDALMGLLAQQFGRDSAPILDQVEITPGLEKALGAALNEELSAGIDPAASRYWRQLPTPDDLKSGELGPLQSAPSPALTQCIKAPPALRRALAHIRLLADDEDGAQLQARLRPGEALVRRDGALWRWDGYTIRPGAPNEAAARLEQRNRLEILRREHDQAAAMAENAATARRLAQEAETAARLEEQRVHSARQDAEKRVDQCRAEADSARNAVGKLEAEAERAASRFELLIEVSERHKIELRSAESLRHQAEAKRAAIEPAEAMETALAAARHDFAEAQRTESTARMHLVQLRDKVERATQRRTQAERELVEWGDRQHDATGRIADLRARLAEAEKRCDEMTRGSNLAAILLEAESLVSGAEISHREAATNMAEGERAAKEALDIATSASAALAVAEEKLRAAEAAAVQADHLWFVVEERVHSRLGAEPALPEVAEISDAGMERARKRFERLAREREDMGPVNLRAEIEATEIEDKLRTLACEQEEITSAIAKLRGSIGHLNMEGRQRIRAQFVEIDRHFQALFRRMFGGGRAHLALVGSDDPLEAGLEIFAEPPGKKLAALSLLSGGEQALTALSLIFAAFRCNPAPVAILDEVDAPLDDANVERFCALLNDVERETGTRFIVITHHHLTMARMDRIFGVTMQERGVSRILSVDLKTAVRLTGSPTAALAAE